VLELGRFWGQGSHEGILAFDPWGPFGHKVLGHKVPGRTVPGHKVFGHKVFGHMVLGHMVIDRNHSWGNPEVDKTIALDPSNMDPYSA
jgi:hypothetical protein